MRFESLNFNNLMDAFSCVHRIPSWKNLSDELQQSVNYLQYAIQNEHRGKIAFDDMQSVGHIIYAPLSKAPVPLTSTYNLIYIRCLYVDPRYRKRGIGSSLLAAMKSDVGNFDGALLTASKRDADWHYEQFERVGFKVIAEDHGLVHMYYPIKKDFIELKIVASKLKRSQEKVLVTLFNDDFCPMRSHLASMVRQAVQKFGDSIELREIDLTPETSKFYGTNASFMINGEHSFTVFSDYDEIFGQIESAVAKKGLH